MRDENKGHGIEINLGTWNRYIMDYKMAREMF